MNTSADTLLDKPYTFDRRNGILRFDSPVFQRTSAGKWSPATLYFVATVGVNVEAVPGTQYYSEPVRWNQTRILGNAGNGLRIIRREDLRAEYIATYTTATPTVVDTVLDNLAYVTSESDAYLTAAALEYVTDQSVTATYRGFVPLELDGRIRQVGVYITDSGPVQCRTVAGLNSEFDPFVLKQAERKRIGFIKGAQERGADDRVFYPTKKEDPA